MVVAHRLPVAPIVKLSSCQRPPQMLTGRSQPRRALPTASKNLHGLCRAL